MKNNLLINKNIWKVSFVLVLSISLIINLNYVFALGVSPGRTTIDFEPGLEKEVSFSVLNSENKNVNVVLFVRGELMDKIRLDEEYVSFSSDEDAKSFKYTIGLPEEFDEPGLHTGEIVVMEVPEDSEKQGAIVGATIAVVTQVYVYVPYPGKYLEADVNVVEASPDYPTIFFIPAISRGKLDINKARAEIEIYSKDGKFIEIIETEEVKILSGERKELIARWDTNVEAGKYKARVILSYDGEEKIIEKEFSVGEVKLEIEVITVKDFRLGEIAKFNILVNNKWGEQVNDAYVNILVYDLANQLMADFKSPNYDAPSLSKIEMIAYWDTEGVKKGNYDGKLILYYGEEETERIVKIKVTETSIEVFGAVTGKVFTPGGGISTTTILILLVSILIAMNVIWLLIFLRRRKKKKIRGLRRRGRKFGGGILGK